MAHVRCGSIASFLVPFQQGRFAPDSEEIGDVEDARKRADAGFAPGRTSHRLIQSPRQHGKRGRGV